MTIYKKQIVITGAVFLILVLVVFILFIMNRQKYYDYNGQQYKVGEIFKDSENCNTCSFKEKGELMCTLMACSPDAKPPDQNNLDISFTYDNGEYEYRGTVQTPTPCHSVETETIVRESFPEDVELRFTTIASDENCTQVIDTKDVSGEIRVSEIATVRVFMNDTIQQGVGVNLP